MIEFRLLRPYTLQNTEYSVSNNITFDFKEVKSIVIKRRGKENAYS